MWPDWFAANLQPPGEVPRLGPCCPVPGHPDRPQEPEPPQQVHPVGARRRCRPPRRLKLFEVGRNRLDLNAVDVQEPVRLPWLTGRYESTRLRHAVSYTHLRAHETGRNLVCRLLLE